MAEVKEKVNINQYIRPLEINGLRGRMLYLPAPAHAKKELLYIYGHHSSLERWWGIAEDLWQYGSVTVPDLPGFGGMSSFYTIGEKPTLDNYADYLASFIKYRFKNRKISVAGLSFGFLIVTRMLQKYPEMTKQIDLLISAAGFAHYSDFKFTPERFKFYRASSYIGSTWLASKFMRYFLFNPFMLRLGYARMHNAKNKFSAVEEEKFDDMMEVEVKLWHQNDIRTWAYTCKVMFTVDNCQQQIDCALVHITVKNDRYFDTRLTLEHLKVIFKKVTHLESDADNHAPSVISSKEESANLFPDKVRAILKRP